MRHFEFAFGADGGLVIKAWNHRGPISVREILRAANIPLLLAVGIESPLEDYFLRVVYLWAQEAEDSLAQSFIETLIAQFSIGSYRVDFAFPELQLGIEFDGHDFHERTVDQVIVRNRRDRDLQFAGWHILHFSGTEFHRAPLMCLDEIVAHYCARINERFS